MIFFDINQPQWWDLSLLAVIDVLLVPAIIGKIISEIGSQQAVWLVDQEFLYGDNQFLAVGGSHFSAAQPCHCSLFIPQTNLLANPI
jgi:hypothetical protein